MQHARIICRSLAAICAVLALYVASWHFARGGIHYFCPHTLQTQFQSEMLLPLTPIPIYRSAPKTYYYELVEYLIDNNYWSPTSDTPAPFVTSHWNRQWRDGQSDIHRQLAWRADIWIQWTEKHPDIASTLWPQVLQLLRSDSQRSQSHASHIMFCARASETFEQF